MDGLGELERLVLSEIDRLRAPEPRALSARRPVRAGATADRRREPEDGPLDPDPEVALTQIVAWLADRPDRDAVVSRLLARLGIEESEAPASEPRPEHADTDAVPPPPSV